MMLHGLPSGIDNTQMLGGNRSSVTLTPGVLAQLIATGITLNMPVGFPVLVLVGIELIATIFQSLLKFPVRI